MNTGLSTDQLVRRLREMREKKTSTLQANNGSMQSVHTLISRADFTCSGGGRSLQVCFQVNCLDKHLCVLC